MSTTEVAPRIQGCQQPTTEEQQGRLKADLQYLRRKGFFKAPGEFPHQGRKCVRCAVPFGRFYNTGAPCIRCRHKVCRQCRIEVRSATDHKEFEWLCNVCFKISSELSDSTDKWIYAGSDNGKTSSSPVELLKHSIRRAWTINGPPARWSASRKSPELCVYRSLPTRQKYRDPLNTPENDEENGDSPSLQPVETQSSVAQVAEEAEDGKKQLVKSETLSRSNSNEPTTIELKRIEKPPNKQEKEEESSTFDSFVHKKVDKQSTSGIKSKPEEQEDTGVSIQEHPSPRISLIKPPRILTKFISPEAKSSPAKHGERKSNIPIFRRSSKEFEDIRSPQESPKRSLIPQRYRGSTDDLRRSREDISVPSLIPKLLSPRTKDDKLKRYDSKDDIRQSSKSSRRDKEENRSPSGRESRVFRREDVGRENLNSNGGGLAAAKGKQAKEERRGGEEERQERAEERVGVASATKSKPDRGEVNDREIEDCVDDGHYGDEEKISTILQDEIVRQVVGRGRENMPEGLSVIEKAFEKETGKIVPCEEEKKEGFDDCGNLEDSMKETSICLGENDEAATLGVNEKKFCVDVSPGKRNDDFHVVRRKFSKEEFSNPDDTDDTPNKRCSSHLSPEASPLSTRSSRYSPRESESEPTPALPRKTGDSSSASQRIREAITRTRRESNSSARYESSGSESVRLSETGLHGYTELARKVKFFGGSGAVSSVIGSDEVVQRDSATSAGEDETQDDNHCRSGPVASQGRSMLRRRRQFDTQGSRRRGRSHARSCCAEELQAYQAFHVIGRGSRQPSPTGNQGQDQPIVDYRRLVFISSDSSSGREEDDADSSCSSSSYLNGLPRATSGHAQSLEDCDWDYFESGSLPLPTGVSLAIGANRVVGETGIPQDWSCCPGRGSAACQACGGSRGANVLPVPVPIPVPVPYPVPVPAALWTGDFVAAASSMISRGNGENLAEGTLRLRGDPAAPWFAWHPRFNQPLARIDPTRLAGAFDPATCTFRPDQVRLYGATLETSIAPATDHERPCQDEKEPGNPPVETFQERTPMEKKEEIKVNDLPKEPEDDDDDDDSESDGNEEAVCQDSLVFERRNKRIFQHPREDSASSSGRSSADSSDLEEDSSTHRFSRVFVVNDDSMTSDNDIEDNGDEDEDSDCPGDGGVTLKRVTALPEEAEPVVLQYVRLLDEADFDTLKGNNSRAGEKNDRQVETNSKADAEEALPKSVSFAASNHSEKRKLREKRSTEKNSNDKKELSSRNREFEELYLASDNDCSEGPIQLKSIKTLDPDDVVASASIDLSNGKCQVRNDLFKTKRSSDSTFNAKPAASESNWDSNIIPDSLEVSCEDQSKLENSNSTSDSSGLSTSLDTRISESSPDHDITRDTDYYVTPIDTSTSVDSDKQEFHPPTTNGIALNSSGSSGDSFTSNDANTTGSEVSSDELHEYEVTPSGVPSFYEKRGSAGGTVNRELFQLSEEEDSKDTEETDVNPEPTSNDASFNDESGTITSSESGIKIEGIEDNSRTGTNEPSNPASSSNEPTLDSKSAQEPASFPPLDQSIPPIDSSTLDQTNLDSRSSNSDIEAAGKSHEANTGNAVAKVETAHADRTQVVGDVISPAAGKSPLDSSGSGGGERCGGVGVEGNSVAGSGSVERRPSTRQENGESVRDSTSASNNFPPGANQHIGNSQVATAAANSNKYRSLVMITQEAAYQPVSVITSDTTTLLQPDEVRAGQGLAGYFQLALEAAAEQPHRRNGPRRPLMVKRAAANQQLEPEVDSGLSVGSASESDDVSVKNAARIGRQENNNDRDRVSREENRSTREESRESPRARVSSQSSDENSPGGVVILEEGLADDDSWVEEVSHDEDEPGATTATEESSEDESNNLGDREEELRGYHRQAIDFTLHTIVEESCEESEAEPSTTTGSPSKKQRPPSASELEKYFFFGLGGEGNNSSMGSREVDSLSETSSIYSEGLESLGQDENPSNQNPERSNSGDGFLNSSRLEKYFLSEFLGFDQDRRDSDGSVGSDSEGRPSPEAQRRKRLVRARGTGRSHSSSLDNLLALTQSSQNLSSQNSLQDLSLNQDSQETLSEGSSTETDVAEDALAPAFGTDGQFDTVKRKKKKPRNIGTQSPRVPEDRNKTPEPTREMILDVENDPEGGSEDSERAKTPQSESMLTSSSPLTVSNNTSSSHSDSSRNIQMSSGDSSYNQKSKQQSRDSGFVGSCDDLLQHQKLPEESQNNGDSNQDVKDRPRKEAEESTEPQNPSVQGVSGTHKSHRTKFDHPLNHSAIPHLPNPSLSRKDSFNNWSSDEETNLMMSKMRQFFKTMVANSNGQPQNVPPPNSGASPAPSPRLPGYSKSRISQNRTKPPQLVYFENELTRLMKTVPGIRDEQVREIVEYLSSEDTWSDSYDSSDYTSSDLEGAAGGRRSALQEQISQSCQQIISKFDTTSSEILEKDREDKTIPQGVQPPGLGRDTAFVYQKLVQSFTKMTGDGVSSDTSSTPHSSPPLIAKVMHHIGSRLVALMHEVSEGGPTSSHHSTWRRYSQHHRTPSSASTTEDDDSTSDSTNAPSGHLLPRSKSHDPLLLINNHPSASAGQEGEERGEASDYERFSWRGSFESALMAADSRTKLSLLACSGDVGGVGASGSASALAMAAKRRSAGDLLFNPKSFSREQLDRVRSCGSIGGGTGGGTGVAGGSIEERIWSNRRRSSVPDANTRGESGASAGDEDTEDELEYPGESRATTLPRGMQSAIDAATNSLPRLPASTTPSVLAAAASGMSASSMHKAHSVYHFLPQHSGVKSARYRPPGFARNANCSGAIGGPKRAVSAPGLQISGVQGSGGKRENSRTRRQQAMSLTTDDGSSLSEACSTPIIGTGSRSGSTHNVIDVDDMDPGLHSGHLATRASLSSLGARSDSMASVYSGAGEGRCCRSVVVTGEVEFALQYDYKHLTFEVHVTKCKNLAPVDVKRKRSDPYVKVYLLPDKSKSGKRKTKVKKHTLNPEFNETLKFHMSLSGLETRTLWLTVWHSDMFGRNDFLGEVRMPLENKIFDDPTPKWYPLQERTEPFDDPIAYKGEVIVGLKFVPPDPTNQQEREVGAEARGAAKSRKNWSRGALHVLVKEARSLQTRAKNSGTCDAFCKSYLLPDKGRSGKQKTGVVRRCGGSPVWGHTFIYKDVSLQELAERGLELTVWDHDRIASNEFLGGVRFNLGTGKHYGKPVDWMDATGRELSLWQNMLERPNFWVEGAVTLRPNLHNHGKNVAS